MLEMKKSVSFTRILQFQPAWAVVYYLVHKQQQFFCENSSIFFCMGYELPLVVSESSIATTKDFLFRSISENDDKLFSGYIIGEVFYWMKIILKKSNEGCANFFRFSPYFNWLTRYVKNSTVELGLWEK